jgi:xanthine dehydrogenase YagT iron-sulfur-binding subunit
MTCLTVNGTTHDLSIGPHETLLDVLRDRIDLTGSKKGCDHGQCGACTVIVDGKAVLSCLTLASRVTAPIETIEGLSDGITPHPMQDAFLEHDAYQCGFCTPGQIMSAVACARAGKATDAEAVRKTMSGNLCRCSAYPMIIDAVLDGAKRMGDGQ